MFRVQRTRTNKGSGLINSVINTLPVEVHLPGYRLVPKNIRLRLSLDVQPGSNMYFSKYLQILRSGYSIKRAISTW